MLSAEDCSFTPWNRPWEPVRSCHASKMRRWGPWARSAGLPGAPTAPKLDIWAVLVSLVLNPWSWPVLSWFAWVHGLVLIQLSLTRVL